jgi:hypothetical protein
MKAVLLASLLAAMPSFAEDKSVNDTANEKVDSARTSVKSGAKTAESKTNTSLAKGRKKTKSGAKKAEDNTNDTLHDFRKKVGTDK